MPHVPRLTSNSKAVRRLRTALQAGLLSGSETPKSVWNSDQLYQKYTLNNFRAAYNRIRKQMSGLPKPTADEDEDDGDDFTMTDRQCTGLEEVEAEEAPILNPQKESVTVQPKLSPDVPNPFLGFTEIYTWLEPGTTLKWVSVVADLPHGVGPKDMSVKVLPGGLTLEITANWPVEMSDALLLHKFLLEPPRSTEGQPKRLPIAPYHPRIVAYEAAPKLRRARNTDRISGTCRIALPCQVHEQAQGKESIGWRGSTSRVLYVELKAVEDESYADKGDDINLTMS